MKIRKAAAPDLRRIVELCWEMEHHIHPREVVPKHQCRRPSLRYFRAQLKEPEVWACVAEERGAVVGYGIYRIQHSDPIHKTRRYGHIMDVMVDDSHRRCGVGRALLKYMLAQLKRRKIKKIRLIVDLANLNAQALYKSLGFAPEYYRMVRKGR